MAMMEALLKIRASVEGEGAIGSMSRALGGLSSTAGRVSGGLKGLLGSVGGLSGALGSLVPAVSGVGLAAMGKSAIDAADNMNDLSQKVGVSVEQLSRLEQAAKAGGTDIDSVGSALIKLNRNLATENKGAMEALQSLGISAKDANGKLKGTDQLMLEVADKFAKMPDGAAKTGAAMALFGKAGANMIPMLNGGRKAIEDLSATMSTKFAKGADALNDKVAVIQSKLLELGVGIGTALMPALNAIADAVVGVTNAFSALPGPLQALIGGIATLTAAFVVLAPAISSIITIIGALSGLSLGATIAGWLGAVGPAVAGITAAFTGLLAWIGGTLIPALLTFFSGPVGWTILAIAAVVAMCIAFREPIGQFLTWVGQAFMTGLQTLGALAWSVFVMPWINLWNNVLRGPVIAIWQWMQGVFQTAFTALVAVAWQLWVQPWINLWNIVLRQPVTIMWNWLQKTWSQIGSFFNTYVVAPVGTAWNNLINGIQSAWQKIADFFPKVFNAVANTAKNAFRAVLQWIAGNINFVAGLINDLIQGFNNLPGPDISFVPTMQIPAFAQGGMVDRPTVALIGEAGPEYVIPASKMAGAASSYLAGARGGAVLQGGGGGGDVQISITTGPTMQANGEQWVTVRDLERAMRTTADGVLNRVRTPAARRVLGIR